MIPMNEPESLHSLSAAAHAEAKSVTKIGTVVLGGVQYDLAANGKALLAVEGKDVYGRPSAEAVPLVEAADAAAPEAGKDEKWATLAQELLDQLAAVMRERDAALARLHQSEA